MMVRSKKSMVMVVEGSLMALIVLIFSRSKTGDLEREIEGMRTEIRELKSFVEAQNDRLQGLQNTLAKPKDE